ncbi:MAG: hypothetical protein ACXAEU_01590 [Candidatus Hodarchaeales archaeon]|jgi:Arc/MetJ-type ribon-helix-helix transcriptional regulator
MTKETKNKKEAKKVEESKDKKKNQLTSKTKAILLRLSENLDATIDKAINLGLANSKSEFIRQSVVERLLSLNLFELPESDITSITKLLQDSKLKKKG